MTWGRVYWPWALIVAAAAFLIPECIALATNHADTLSEYTWRELNVRTATAVHGIHTAAWYISVTAWLLFVVVITWHIWWAGP